MLLVESFLSLGTDREGEWVRWVLFGKGCWVLFGKRCWGAALGVGQHRSQATHAPSNLAGEREAMFEVYRLGQFSAKRFRNS
jgi:hypothetical protein